MLTLGIVDGRTDCKADNIRDHRIQGTASCQLAQEWVVGFFTLGPKRTCDMSYETTDDSLENNWRSEKNPNIQKADLS